MKNKILAIIILLLFFKMAIAQDDEGCWREVAPGAFHTLAIHDNRTLWGWGNNSFGQLGNGTRTGSAVPMQIGNDNDWLYVSTYHHHSAAIKTDGSLWVWGTNEFGEIGDGTNTDRLSPVRIVGPRDWAQISVGGDFTVGIREDGTLWSWGRNNYGQLGLGDTNDRKSPIQIGAFNSWVMIEAGYNHCLAVRKLNNFVLIAEGWGNNLLGQLGWSPQSRPFYDEPKKVLGYSIGGQEFGAGHDVHISAGLAHSVVYGRVELDDIDGLAACGYNEEGQLGLGNFGGIKDRFEDIPGFVRDCRDRSGGDPYCNVRWIATGDFHTIVGVSNQDQDGFSGLLAWGDNSYGQLGIGNLGSQARPYKIPIFWKKGMPVVFSNALHSTAIGDGQIDLGSRSIVSNKIWSWGHNLYGQLGDGSTTNRSFPVLIKCPLISSTNNQGKPGVKLFPNPTNGMINIESDISQFEIITIITHDGKVLKTIYSPNQESIDLTGFPPGIYIIKMENKDLTIHELIVLSE